MSVQSLAKRVGLIDLILVVADSILIVQYCTEYLLVAAITD